MIPVPKTAVNMVWGVVDHYIESATLRTNTSSSDLRHLCATDNAFSLSILADGSSRIRGAVVLEILDDAVQIVALGGELPRGWEDRISFLMDELLAMLGKSGLVIDGRKGWIRKLRRLGFELQPDGLLTRWNNGQQVEV